MDNMREPDNDWIDYQEQLKELGETQERPMNISIHQHRGVDIVTSQVDSHRWLATWKFPGEDDAIHAYGPSRSQALGHAKKMVDQFFDGYQDFPVVWRKGEDQWSGIEVENGVVPSDALPFYE